MPIEPVGSSNLFSQDYEPSTSEPQGQSETEAKPFQDSPGAQEFHSWNDNLSTAYTAYAGELPSTKYPLYRAANQVPNEVFQEHGHLKSSTQLELEAGGDVSDEAQNFSLEKHQAGEGSVYTSTTRDLNFASEFAGEQFRQWIYVMDPQPHGRDTNAANLARIEHGINTEHSSQNPASPIHDNYLLEQEVAVPGPIHSSEIRGAIPVDEETNKPNFEKLVKNPLYKSPAERLTSAQSVSLKRSLGGGDSPSEERGPDEKRGRLSRIPSGSSNNS